MSHPSFGTARRRPRRSGLGLALIALLAMPVAPAQASDPPLPSSLFAFESDSNYVGQPNEVYETAPATSMIFNGLTPNDPGISVTAYTPTETWTVKLEPPDGEQLHVGTYDKADGAGPADAELRITRFGSGCGPSAKSAFVIHELTRNASTGAPTSLALSFQFWCDDDWGPMVGRLRLNSTLPIASLSVPHESRIFGGHATGTSVTHDLTIEANGDGAVSISGIQLSGTDAAQFQLDDPCTGTTLQPGQTCTFAVTFAPTTVGDLKANLTIEHGGPVAPQILPLIGAGLLPTTTTIHVEPESRFFTNGMQYVGTVSPNPGGGSMDIWIDGVLLSEAGIEADGTVRVPRARVLGPHTAQMHFLGAPGHAESWSPTFDFTISPTTATALSPGSGSFPSGTAIPFVATAGTGGNLLYPGGTVTIRDLTLGEDLVSGPVDQVQPSVAITLTLADGTHDIRARYSGVAGLLDASSTTKRITVGGIEPPPPPPPGGDAIPPAGTLSIAGVLTKSTDVTLATAASDPGSGVSQVALSNDGTTWTTRAYAATQAWTLPAADGTRTVFAKWKDVAGNWSEVATDTIVLDTVVPKVGAPSRSLPNGTTVVGGKIAVRSAWSGSDATSGVASYQFQQRTDGGAWTTVSTTLIAPLLGRPLATQHSYAFRVRAVDRAGNIGAWVSGSTFNLSRYGESNPKVKYKGVWKTSTSTAFWGGAAKRSSTAGAKASLTFTGRSFAWVARMGQNRGKATVYVNGTKVATVDLYAPTYQNQRVVWTRNWSSSATRKVTIRVSGTVSRPRVDLDALVTTD